MAPVPVLGFGIGDGLQDRGSICNGAGQRSHMIERLGKRNHAARADASIGRLKPDHSALRRRFADGASRISADGTVA